MARCTSCSAPLPANQNRCLYCGIRNDVDLTGKQTFDVSSQLSSRICPHCEIEMQTVSLNKTHAIALERCNQCFGLFFDPGELESYLEKSVSGVFDINLEHIKHINQDRYRTSQQVKYIKCPVCENFMNRVNFAHRSGVVIDRCKAHGIWLDNGELTHLLEWKKAGGQLLHERQVKKSQQQATLKPTAVRRRPDFDSDSLRYGGLEDDLFTSISDVIFKLFE